MKKLQVLFSLFIIMAITSTLISGCTSQPNIATDPQETVDNSNDSQSDSNNNEATPTIDANLIGKTFASGEYEYTILENGSISIAGYTGGATDLVLPTEIDGYPVSAVGEEAFHGNDSIITLTVPGSIMEIGASAFQNCENLTSVTLEEGVQKLGDLSFANNRSLIEVNVPDSVFNMGLRVWNQDNYDEIYTYYNNLAYMGKVVVDIDEVNFDGSVQFMDGTVGIASEAFISYATASGANTSQIISERLIIPDTVKYIGSSAFEGQYYRNLESIEVPASVEFIGGSAIPSEIKIYGATNSAAESYASSNGNDFVIIN